jgi:hypothetical protein
VKGIRGFFEKKPGKKLYKKIIIFLHLCRLLGCGARKAADAVFFGLS